MDELVFTNSTEWPRVMRQITSARNAGEEQAPEDSTKSSHEQIGGSDGVDEWSHHEDLTFVCASLRADSSTSLSIASKNPLRETQTAGSTTSFPT